MNRYHLIALSALAAVLAVPANASIGPLKRKATLGIQLQPAPAGKKGVAIGNVFPGGTGAAIGVATGDILTSVDGKAVSAPADVVAIAQTIRSGEPVTMTLDRDGAPLALAGKATPKPFEQYANATVDYGEVPFRDGRLRDILVMPAGKPDVPVVFYLQGYTCGSMEGSAVDPFGKQFGDAVLSHGLGYYRVEKIGVGDSDGSIRCQDVDYSTELEGFRAAYRHLVEKRKVGPDHIFMIGHSMGGLQAPMLAAERAPRGVAVYGTVVRNWGDYHRDLDATQPFLIAGADPAETARVAEGHRDLFKMFYFDKMSPDAIAKARPEYADAMREIFAWDGHGNMFGRSWKFAQELASLRLLDAWKNSKTNVLAIYGGSDMVALTDVDHRYLADIANYWRPGSGTYVEIPDTTHGMNLTGSRSAIREGNRSGKPIPEGPFNPKVVDALATWIAASMAKPPISPGG